MAVCRIAAGIVAGVSLFSVSSLVVGEIIATLPPIFTAKASAAPKAMGIPYEEVTFPSTDGLMLRGWFFPAQNALAPAVLYAPSTGHDQRSGLSLVPSLHAAGYHVLLFSYRGHGLSDGNRFGFTYGAAESKDVDAAVAFLGETRGIEEIGVIGHSAGAVASILSAARNPHVGAVVALAPFNSVREVWHTSRPPAVPPFLQDFALWLAGQRKAFREEEIYPLRLVERIAPRPLLLIHGSRDRRITTLQIQQLFAAARAPKALWLVEGATHKGIRSPVLDVLMADVIGFLNAALRSGSGPLILRPTSDPLLVRCSVPIKEQAEHNGAPSLRAGWRELTPVRLLAFTQGY